jgi:hypothetical protein
MLAGMDVYSEVQRSHVRLLPDGVKQEVERHRKARHAILTGTLAWYERYMARTSSIVVAI